MDDEPSLTKPKPLPTDFYLDQAVTVQDSVGAGIEIDVNDINSVTLDDECEMHSSRIDQAVIVAPKEDTPLASSCKDNKGVDNGISNIDKSKVDIDMMSSLTDSEIPLDIPSDASRIDKAMIDLEELESQIEPITSSNDIPTQIASTELLSESRIDTAKALPADDKSGSSETVLNDSCQPNLSNIDNAEVIKIENSTERENVQENKMHVDQGVSRIDDINIQSNDAAIKDNTESTSTPIIVDDSSRLDNISVMTTSQEGDKNQHSSDINVTDNEVGKSHIDSATPENPSNDEKTQPQDIKQKEGLESSIDNIKVPSIEAEITVTSPSPPKNTAILATDKFVYQSFHT